MSPVAVLPILGALKWPLTVTGAVLVFGLSSEGTLAQGEKFHDAAAPIDVFIDALFGD